MLHPIRYLRDVTSGDGEDLQYLQMYMSIGYQEMIIQVIRHRNNRD